ncbi:MAG: PP2C family protein-serine/threonine phosphatase [Arenimonas sp.]|uniref:PP2C family protein-serine/threonine phosphatase n=1 Tax=Arenimonas sp. TaxID=1872635 RepID=UPI003C05E59D
MFEVGQISHPGRKRLLNEDTYDLDAGPGVAVVVDGMGGPDAGDVAAAFVRDHLRKALQQGDSPADALRSAGQALRIQRPQKSASPSGASAIAARYSDGVLDLAWVGTCSAIFSDGRQYRRIQSDAEAKGSMKNGVANAIQALGVTATEKLCISEARITLKRGECVMFCTDGMLETCSGPELETSLCDPRLSAQESVELLLMHALRGEANNNLTALLLRLS